MRIPLFLKKDWYANTNRKKYRNINEMAENKKKNIEILTIVARKPEVKVQIQASKSCLAQANYDF
jgi:hypothetical protein